MKNSKLNAIKLNSIVNNYNCNNESILYAYLNAKLAKMNHIQTICNKIEESLLHKGFNGEYFDAKYKAQINSIWRDAEFKKTNFKWAIKELEKTLNENTFHSFKLIGNGKVDVITE